MKVSIIMCSYNVEPFIEKALDCITQQTYTNWELIIVDDASTDNTRSLIQKYLHDERIKLYPAAKNMGYLKNKNRAFEYVTGDLITQLDSDDTSPIDRLEKQVNAFINHPELMICGTNYRQIDQFDNPLPAKEYEKDFWIETLQDEYPFWFPGLMFRKSLVAEIGLFSEYFKGIYGDDNYWAFLANKKYPIYFVKDILYNYRINPNSITNVFDNPRKMIVHEILSKLKEQLQTTGTDWLQEGKEDKMKAYEETLYNNKKLMADKYRTWAAKAIDKKDFKQAKHLLNKAFKEDKTQTEFYKTFLYYLRAKYL